MREDAIFCQSWGSNKFRREKEKYGFGRTIEAPTNKKNLIHEDNDVVVQYLTHLPNKKEINLLINIIFFDLIELNIGLVV